MSHVPIRHADGDDLVLLRDRLKLDGPCRGGRLRVAASGPVQVYLDGHRVGGAPVGALAERTLWQPLSLEGAWEAGEHELLVVTGQSAGEADPWFVCHGRLHAAVAGAPDHGIESGLHWQALALPRPPADAQVDERYSALEDRRHLDDAWAGVETVDAEVTAIAPATEESLVVARRFAAFEETTTEGGLSFVPAAVAPRRCKCVHREGLLAGPTPAATVRTESGRALTFVLDLGRIVIGYPALRLREGYGGVIDVGTAHSWGQIDHTLRYVCGAGRQEWYGLTPVRCRYLVVRLSGFEEEVQLERLALDERFVATHESGAELRISDSYGLAWETGRPSLQGSRLDLYPTHPLPTPCDWLAVRAVLLNDAVRTGHTATGQATLLARSPDPGTVGPADRAFALCLEAHDLYADASAIVEQLLPAAVAAARSDPETSARDLALQAAATAAAERLCRRYGQTADADSLAPAVETARQRLQRFWRPERGLFADGDDDCSQLTNGLALLADAAPRDQAATIASSLRGPEVSPVQDLKEASLLAEGLWHAGQGARAHDVVDTWWLRIVERKGLAWRDKRAADAAGAAPGPEYLIVRYLLGISSEESGLRRRRVQPDLLHTAEARGGLPTPTGSIDIDWRTREVEGARQTTLRLEVEGEGITELALDRGGRRNPTLSVNGEVVWRNEKVYPNASVHEIGAEADAVVFVFGQPGRWDVVLE